MDKMSTRIEKDLTLTPQQRRIVEYMRMFGTITQKEADSLAVKRLASRIEELRKKGYPIITEQEVGINIYGDRTRYGKYRMVEKA